MGVAVPLGRNLQLGPFKKFHSALHVGSHAKEHEL